ncbi:hypothetical protein HF908_22830 (plasmid) [Ralstonia pseudosolanacearum]|uniref:hypothetical protein n=1 Tax=Ralstonia pseudosolanacearum TaxID=1310165 RepID=UPI001868D652|nr:hypothetical protein [Ralstonia pseudosolanacearum]QOK94247.1 hypothetical protein HF908_22830 [Ralstonia pseudosolanacearum]
MFRIGSDKSIDGILSARRDLSLPFEDMLECDTRCLTGCSACIDTIRACVKGESLVFEAEHQA